MRLFPDFFGNPATAGTLESMIANGRIPQTLLLEGPEGVGKATLARRFASRLLGGAEKIEQDDLSLETNRAVIAEREKLTSEKRAEDPLLFATHPDFVTFPPEGKLRQLSIHQMRLLKERAQFKPLKGDRRVFLIDQLDRANAQAADSLLKTLEEPPEHLILILTAANIFELPPTIRSRSITLHMAPIPEAEMRAFAESRNLPDREHRIALAGGCPGIAATLDLAAVEKRRGILLALLEAAAGTGNFAAWAQQSESYIASQSEKIDLGLPLFYSLLEDVLVLQNGGTAIRNTDIHERLERIAARVNFEWLRAAVARVDEMPSLQRRNVQKGLILDSFAVASRAEG